MPKILERKRVEPRFSVDFPRQNETINSPCYTLRISAPEGVKSVDVSIDDGEWQPCRQAAGYWWYDWSGYQSGDHDIVTRIETHDGQRLSAEPHEFLVDLQGQPKPA